MQVLQMQVPLEQIWANNVLNYLHGISYMGLIQSERWDPTKKPKEEFIYCVDNLASRK